MINKIHGFFQERVWLVTLGIVLLTGITLALTLLPSDEVLPEQVWSFDKLGHLLIFGVWTFLIGYYRLIKRPNAVNLFTIFFLGVLFGAAVEALQYLMPFNRSADAMDIVFDAFGCFLAVLTLHLFAKRDSEY